RARRDPATDSPPQVLNMDKSNPQLIFRGARLRAPQEILPIEVQPRHVTFLPAMHAAIAK
ncbi:MAG: hypothetical protein KDD69_16790, partial [Bdellovibrionales bacterium]|nr:hypothetical protein [Bdellovibrionales bacterium]